MKFKKTFLKKVSKGLNSINHFVINIALIAYVNKAVL
jgi:hypothetical protein